MNRSALRAFQMTLPRSPGASRGKPLQYLVRRPSLFHKAEAFRPRSRRLFCDSVHPIFRSERICMRRFFPTKAQDVYRWTVGIWGLLLVMHLGWYFWGLVDARPSAEVYANTFSFQLAAFLLTRLPYWVVAIVVLLLCEFALFGRRAPPKV